MNVNFYGTVYLNKTFLTSLQREQSYLVNVSSGWISTSMDNSLWCFKVKLMTEIYSIKNLAVLLCFRAINTNISANSNVKMDVEEEEVILK